MAWASKKQYAILMNSKEGKDLATKIGEMEQDEFQNAFAKLLGKGGSSVSYKKEEDEDLMDDDQYEEYMSKKQQTPKENKSMQYEKDFEHRTDKEKQDDFNALTNESHIAEVVGDIEDAGNYEDIDDVQQMAIDKIAKDLAVDKNSQEYKTIADKVGSYFTGSVDKETNSIVDDALGLNEDVEDNFKPSDLKKQSDEELRNKDRKLYNLSDEEKNEMKKQGYFFSGDEKILDPEKHKKAYNNMQKAVDILNKYSKGQYDFSMDDDYLDYGQKWKWSNIHYNPKDKSKNPSTMGNNRTWLDIVNANNDRDIYQAIVNDDYLNREMDWNKSQETPKQETTQEPKYTMYNDTRVKVYDEIPNGWEENNTFEAPQGYKYITNGKSFFDKDYKDALIKVSNNPQDEKKKASKMFGVDLK